MWRQRARFDVRIANLNFRRWAVVVFLRLWGYVQITKNVSLSIFKPIEQSKIPRRPWRSTIWSRRGHGGQRGHSNHGLWFEARWLKLCLTWPNLSATEGRPPRPPRPSVDANWGVKKGSIFWGHVCNQKLRGPDDLRGHARPKMLKIVILIILKDDHFFYNQGFYLRPFEATTSNTTSEAMRGFYLRSFEATTSNTTSEAVWGQKW